MLDLDAIQARYEAAFMRDSQDPYQQLAAWATVGNDVPALVAELRAAREVIYLAQTAIAAARGLIGAMPVHVREPCYCPPQAHPTATAFAAFEAAYDELTGEADA